MTKPSNEFGPDVDKASAFTLASMTRKENRAVAARALAAIGERHGAEVETVDLLGETVVRLIFPRGHLSAGIDPAAPRIGAFLGHLVAGKEDRFAVGWSNSNHHRPHHKATLSTDLGFGVFLAHCNAACRDLASGRAFAPREG